MLLLMIIRRMQVLGLVLLVELILSLDTLTSVLGVVVQLHLHVSEMWLMAVYG